jgi:hypothetical protein
MESCVTRLSQLNAVVNGEKTRSFTELTTLHHLVQKNAGLLSGIIRTYTPLDDEGDKLPPESTRVQTRVQADVLPALTSTLSRMFDLQLTQDHANTQAFADVVVDGAVLLPAVPVTYLLFLEKQLVHLQTFVGKLPVLDPSDEWSWSDDLGVHRSNATKTLRTKKVLRNHVKAEATDKHPAQVELFQEDRTQGTWETVKLSGAAPAAVVRAMQVRVSKLIDAVRVARDEANTITVQNREAAGAVFGYLLGGAVPAHTAP